MLDLLLINDKQSKTGLADVAKHMKDRQSAPIEKRVAAKMAALGSISQT
jgi:hypothetical protein